MFRQFLPNKREDLFFIGVLFFYLSFFVQINPSSFAIDDYMSYYHSSAEFMSKETRDFFIGDGRWGNYLVAYVLFNIFGAISSITVSYFFGILYQFQLAYCCWLVARFFQLNISDKWLIIPFLLLITHPHFAEIQTFKSATTITSFSFYLPIGIIGTVFLFNQKSFWKFIGVLLITYALSVYQLIVNVVAILILLKGLDSLINKKEDKLISNILTPFFFLGLSLVIYLIINKLALYVLDIPLTNRAEIVSPINFIKQIARIILMNPYNFFKELSILLIPGLIAIVFNNIANQANLKQLKLADISLVNIATFIGLVFFTSILNWFNTWIYHIAKFGKIVPDLAEYALIFLVTSSLFHFIRLQIDLKNYYFRTLLIVIIIPVSFLAISGISLILSHLYLPYRVFTGTGFFVAIIAALYYTKIQDQLLFKNLTLGICTMMVLSFTLSTNSIFFDATLVNQLDRNKANRIVSTLEQIPNFKEKKILIHTISNNYAQPIPTKAGDLNESAFNREWSKLRLLEYVSGYNFKTATDSDIEFAKSQLTTNQARWPAKESILVEKDLIIIFI